MTSTLVLRDIDDAQQFVRLARQQGRRIGLVPTMGGLHDGHLSLVQAANKQCDETVATVFVNPKQFGPGEDLERYPRTWDADLRALSRLGTAMVFAPDVETMFSVRSTTHVDPPAVARTLEGDHRPGHFRGVATVVLKLFQILPADIAFFGEKDFQQCLVIRDMVRDLNVPIELQFCATVRDADGLAMSSRNKFLTTEQRDRALGLSQAIQRVRGQVQTGETDGHVLRQAAIETLRTAGVDRIDYVALRDPESFEELTTLESDGVLLIAARFGSTRLIDNCRLRCPNLGSPNLGSPNLGSPNLGSPNLGS